MLFDSLIFFVTQLKFFLCVCTTGRYKEMVAACRNLISSSTKYRQVLNQNIDQVPYTEDEEFMTAPQVKSNLFILSLFTRVSDHGILYSSPANFRPAMGEALVDRKLFGRSLVDEVYSPKDQSIFATNAMCVLFYQEKDIREGDTHNYDGCFLSSIAKETVRVRSDYIKELSIKFRKIGVFPSQNQLLKLAYILNVHVAPPSDASARPPRHLDFASILQAYHGFEPSSNASLQQFLKKQLKWPFFDIDLTARLSENMRKVRSFFQCLHPIGLAYIEGNHRALLASKLLYGQGVHAFYPLPHLEEIMIPRRIPESSALYYTNLEVKIMIPGNTRMNATRLITGKMLQSCRKRSMKVAEQKKYVIKETWKYFLDTTVRDFQRDIDFRPLSIEDFLKIVMPSNRKERDIWHTRDREPYINMTYKTIEILVHAMLNTAPSMEMAQQRSVDKDRLLEELCNEKRLGFGSASFCPTKVEYKKDALTERKFITSNSFRDVWKNTYIVQILPELFVRLAPIRGGLEALAGYAKSDVRYLEPTFIGAIILNPVTQIVNTILEICDNNSVWCNSVENVQEKKKNQKKLRIILQFWYTMRYLETLIYFQPSWDGMKSQDTAVGREHNDSFYDREASLKSNIQDYLGTTKLAEQIAQTGFAPMVLYNLPKEFKRWRDHYMQKGCNITTTTEPRLRKPPRKYWLWNDEVRRRHFYASGMLYDVENVRNGDPEVEYDVENKSDSENEWFPDEVYTEEDDSFLDITPTNRVSVYEVFECSNDLKDPPPVEEIEVPGISYFVPFDVSLPLHPSIVAAAQHHYDPAWKTIENHTSWDPFYLTQGMVNGVFDFGIRDFYQGDAKKRIRRERKEISKRIFTMMIMPKAHRIPKTQRFRMLHYCNRRMKMKKKTTDVLQHLLLDYCNR